MVRRRRDEDMSDIEDANNSQHTNNNDDVEEDEEVPRRKKSAGKQLAKKEKKPVINKAGDAEDEDDEDERIDVNNFQDQPLTKINGQTLKGLMNDWEQILNKTHTSSEAMIIETAISLADNLGGDDDDISTAREAALKQLDGTLRKIIDLESDLQARQQAIDEIYQQVALGEEVADANDRYVTAVEEKESDYLKKTSRQKYMKNEQYIRFKQEIFSAQNEEGKGMPPMTEFISKEDGDESDDDDIEMGGVALELKDPITLTYLENPVTSPGCGHSFSESSLREYCKGRVKPCPSAGCGKQVNFALCKPNKVLERAVQQALKRQRRAEEHDDDDAEEVDD